TTIAFVRVGERLEFSDGHFGDRGDLHARRRRPPFSGQVLGGNQGLPGGERSAGQHHELGEVSTRDEVVFGPIDGEVFAPLRWIALIADVGGARDVVRIAGRLV